MGGGRRGADGASQAAGSGGGRDCDGLTSLSAIGMRGPLCGIVHSRLHPPDALSTLPDCVVSPGSDQGMPRSGKYRSGMACQNDVLAWEREAILGAELNIPEK